MSRIELTEHKRGKPREAVERMAAANDWSFERAGEDEITILVRGKWTDYRISFTWMFDIEALHLACAFEFKVPDHCPAEVVHPLSITNEPMWIGHSNSSLKDGLLLYRN